MTDSINANVVVSMPSQLFTMARSFKAVANGKIYIGKIDTDPVNPENQIQVYIENEDGSHVPVSQPIIINAAGYPVYNGQIAKFVTVKGHSMAVYDAYGAQQFYYPNVLKYDPDQLRLELANGNGSLVNTRYGTLDEYVEKTPSILATKYMNEAELAALASGDLSINHQPKVQMVMDEAHNLKCSVYFPTGIYCFDTAVNVWSYVRSVWGDGSATITRRYRTYFVEGSTTEIDPARDTRKLFRFLSGAVGAQSVHGLQIDGNARSIEVAASGTSSTTGIPDQTYYGDIEPGGTSPYIHGPDGNIPVAGETYYNHDKKTSGLVVFDMVFKDAPGGCVVGNARNLRVSSCSFLGWYDHAVYTAGAAFTDQGNGILVGDITVTGNTFRNRINTRGNGAVKGRFGFNRYTVTGNTFDIIDYCMAFDTGGGTGAAQVQPWGQITVTGNTATCDGMWMMISNNKGTEWFNTNWLRAITISGNTVLSKDRIFLLGASGSNDYLMTSYNVNIENNVFQAPTFMTIYTHITNSDWRIDNNTINITGDGMIIGVDQPEISNSSLRLTNNIMGRLLVTSTANLHVSNFEKVLIQGNEFRNCSFSFGSYSTSLDINSNKFIWNNAIPGTRFFGSMYSNLGNGFNYVRLNRNKFEGTYTRFNIKCSSSCVVEINDNDFGVNNSYLLDISPSGYTPKIMRVNNNILNGGNIIASLPAGTALTGPYNYLEMIGNFISSSTPGVPAASCLFRDTGGQSWLSHYQTIRCVKNTFRDAINGLEISGSVSGSVSTTNKLWFGENATLNSTFTCNYPSSNKANTDIIQTSNI
ncbi:phage head-binding domain-containing protein [Escherichia fergusonii]|uniref:phage head-binding domain-containing protein n=1 Tax=Escherichia fergusonii TaxID=564 RepID=UPI0006148C34|nr:phage head-binding domain-containing protein [Escherichia fergusonii]KWW07730.1 hypothetical protein VK87_0205760 [Escherichia fergusonii]